MVAESKTTSIPRDIQNEFEMLLDKHIGGARNEVIGELSKLLSVKGVFEGSAGMAALGTILGGFAFVHLMHRVTGLPLWLCFAGSSAIACIVGAGLLKAADKKISENEQAPTFASH